MNIIMEQGETTEAQDPTADGLTQRDKRDIAQMIVEEME